jgi:hypothetical protein
MKIQQLDWFLLTTVFWDHTCKKMNAIACLSFGKRWLQEFWSWAIRTSINTLDSVKKLSKCWSICVNSNTINLRNPSIWKMAVLYGRVHCKVIPNQMIRLRRHREISSFSVQAWKKEMLLTQHNQMIMLLWCTTLKLQLWTWKEIESWRVKSFKLLKSKNLPNF